MNDHELMEALEKLGIDEGSWRVIALLPLVEVAWADGSIHKLETKEIEAIAAKHGFLTGNGPAILHKWLTVAPSHRYLRRGRRALAILARRRLLLDGHSLDEVATLIGFCERVAAAAGGLYNVVATVDPRETIAIQAIAEALALNPQKAPNWAELAAL